MDGYSILNVYRQPQTPDVIEYITHLSPSTLTLIGGDFNFRHHTFEPGASSAYGGASVAQWASSCNLDYIGQSGRATHRAGHTLDLTLSNIPFAKTIIRHDMHCGSDHETQVTTIARRGHAPLHQFHYRVPADNTGRFVGLVEAGITHIPNQAMQKTLFKSKPVRKP